MNFGLVEGLTAALAKPAAELNARLDNLAVGLEGLRQEVRAGNHLLAKIIEQNNSAYLQKAANDAAVAKAAKRTAAGKVMT